LGVFAFVNIQAVSVAIEDQLIGNNIALTMKSADQILSSVKESDTNQINQTLDKIISEESVLYTAARDSTSNVIADARVGGTLPPGQRLKELSQESFFQQSITIEELQDILYVIVPISAGTTDYGTLEIAYDLGKTQESIQQTTTTLLIYGATIVLAIALLSILFTRYATSQLQKVVNAAEEIGRGNLDSEVPITKIEEIAIVGETLNFARVEMKNLYASLEGQVEDYEKRNQYLSATATITRDTIAITDLQELLGNIVKLIDERFDFTQQGIFLIDDSKEWAVLRAVSGEGSQGLKDRNIRFKVGQEGIIGHVTSTGILHVSQDVTEDTLYRSDIGTIDTRSEVVIPLKFHGDIFGALDIQSREIKAFSDEDINILQTLADQIAIAISNARLFQQTRENVEFLQKSYEELRFQSWSRITKDGSPIIGYYSDSGGTTSLTRLRDSTESKEFPELELPLVAHSGQVIGKIIARKSSAQGDWDLDEISVMETLGSQLGIALESAQLFQDTQRRAAFERITREAATRMRESLEIEAVLRSATTELRKSLNLGEVEIRLGSNPVKSGD
jgi:GAF domain-containing protein